MGDFALYFSSASDSSKMTSSGKYKGIFYWCNFGPFGGSRYNGSTLRGEPRGLKGGWIWIQP